MKVKLNRIVSAVGSRLRNDNITSNIRLICMWLPGLDSLRTLVWVKSKIL